MSCVIALGFFDGVHLGHAALLAQAKSRADALGVVSAALTFDRPPETRVTGRRVPLLSQADVRADTMRRLYGIEEVMILPFDDAMRQMPWRDFTGSLLMRQFGAVGFVVGHDFRFGRDGEGKASDLVALCRENGLFCDVIPQVAIDGLPVSSSAIRGFLERGEPDRAALFLGRRHSLTLPVVRGRGLGRLWGFPTVNMLLPETLQCPKPGVYQSFLNDDGHLWPSVTNIGSRPTVEPYRGETVAESHIFGFDGDLYGRTCAVELERYMRPEQKFGDFEQLREQVTRDRLAAQTLHGLT